ncbi:hypothetical protein BD408DRAFT_446541 [Parasitella parasitica]|nr:hypothetical protein BD408DRAFT_446541 [Parasitella parasitica]
MIAVCGICVYKSSEERCFILMPGCGHVFDKACIDNSLGLEYTCPECQNTYLLPSPYRPTNLAADNSEHQECFLLKKSVAEANKTIDTLKLELLNVRDELNIERRSHKECSKALSTASKALETIKSRYQGSEPSRHDHSKQLNSSTSNSLTTANVSAPQVHIRPTEIEADKSGNERHSVKKKSKIQQKSVIKTRTSKKDVLIWKKLNQDTLKSFELLKTYADTATKRLQSSQFDSNLLQIKKEKLFSKFKSSVQVVDIVQQHSKLKKAERLNLQGTISACKKKMDELEKSEKGLSTINQQLQAELDKLVVSLPDGDAMKEYQTAQRKLQISKRENTQMLEYKHNIKQKRIPEKLSHIFRKNKDLTKTIASHASNVKQAENIDLWKSGGHPNCPLCGKRSITHSNLVGEYIRVFPSQNENCDTLECIKLKKDITESHGRLELLQGELSDAQNTLSSSHQEHQILLLELEECTKTMLTANSALAKLKKEYDILERSRDSCLSELISLKVNDMAITSAPTPKVQIDTAINNQRPPTNEDFKSKYDSIKNQYVILQKKYLELLNEKKKRKTAKEEEKSSERIMFRWNKENQDILKRLYYLKNLENTVTTKLEKSQEEAKSLKIDTEKLLSKAKVLIQVAEMVVQFSKFEEENPESQQKISVFNEKMEELEKSGDILWMSNQQLQEKRERLVALLPDQDIMQAHQTVSNRLQTVKKRNAILLQYKQNFTREKLQEKLENLLMENNELMTKMTSHATNIEQVEKLSQNIQNMSI